LLQTSLLEVYQNEKVEFELILVGHTGTFNHELPFEVHSLGFVNNEEQLVNLYAAVHLLVVPSRLEAFSQVTCEAHACGLPVVAYDIGGVPDIISHQQSGWLAKPYDATDFANGIEWVLENEEFRVDLGAYGRQKVLSNFSSEVVAEKYMELYDSIVQGKALK
jgi:glycosyltransferase involved in cell wall biosynthesis